ncbi:MAG: carbohydrate-binding domain-containing protein [Ignavibacteriales bacterium]|nr:carbohydrate-binding domain-containing protein [Ignavibacteriales bacterium]
MSIKIILKVFVLFILVLILVKCENNKTPTETNDSEITNSSDSGNSVVEIISENKISHEDPSDYIWDAASVKKITLNGNSITSETSTGISINGSVLTISALGNYELSGTLSNGQIIIDIADSDLTGIEKTSSANSDEIVRLILNNANITNSTSSPIYIANSSKTVIVLSDNSTNTLTDGTNYTYINAETEEPNSTIFSNDDLTFYGNGTLTVNAKFNDAIASEDGLIIKSGNISIISVDDAIRGKDYLIIKDGTVKITSNGEGLKSDNTEDATRGYISLEGGSINITSFGDGISAATDVLISDGTLNIKTTGTNTTETSSKAVKGLVSVVIDNGDLTINSADDAVHSNGSVTINNGTFSIASKDDGIHADNTVIINDGTIYILSSVEGVEGHYIYVNGGSITVNSIDDSFNSSAGSRTETDDNSCIYIHGGYIVLIPSNGDGLDSNGDMQMTAGTVIIHGPSSQPEVMIDYNGTFIISGGFLTSSGSNSNMTQAPSSSSTQYCVKIMFNTSISASTIIHVQDSDGNNVLTFQPTKKFQSVVFSSSDLQKGKTYSIYKGGSSTGSSSNGLYQSGTYSGGTLYKSFSVSNTITNVN